jgi:hypothetical protein
VGWQGGVADREGRSFQQKSCGDVSMCIRITVVSAKAKNRKGLKWRRGAESNRRIKVLQFFTLFMQASRFQYPCCFPSGSASRFVRTESVEPRGSFRSRDYQIRPVGYHETYSYPAAGGLESLCMRLDGPPSGHLQRRPKRSFRSYKVNQMAVGRAAHRAESRSN